MDEIGLFPLQLVLLPEELVPLHIFEPRYRELIGECIEQQTAFGLILEDGDGLRGIGTSATVVQVLERLPDGRLNIVVRGERRFRLVRETDGRSFRTGAIEWLPDGDGQPDAASVDALLSAFRSTAAAAEAEVEEPAPDDPGLSWRIAAQVDLGVDAKQELLEARDEAERVDRLTALLAEAERSIRWRSEARERAQTNGKVRHPPDAPPG
ncbi:MAG: LON peptidase substrate-binding domain-containing protein [Thermoleophilia bacterium]